MSLELEDVIEDPGHLRHSQSVAHGETVGAYEAEEVGLEEIAFHDVSP